MIAITAAGRKPIGGLGVAEDDADKWARAKAVARRDTENRARYDVDREERALASRFDHCSAGQVVDMYERGVNDKGTPLTGFELRALAERWCALFGELPPSDAAPKPAAPEDPMPPNEAMLGMHAVVRITGLSESTIKRRVADRSSDFPKPVKLSTRRIGWHACEIKAWLARRALS